MSKYDQAPPPPSYPAQAHYDAGPVNPNGGGNADFYNQQAQYGQQQPGYGPPQGQYQQYPPQMQYQQYPNQQYPPQGMQQDRGGSGAGGCCAGIMGALACCCCLDCLF